MLAFLAWFMIFLLNVALTRINSKLKIKLFKAKIFFREFDGTYRGNILKACFYTIIKNVLLQKGIVLAKNYYIAITIRIISQTSSGSFQQ